jgi:hypothetical protein
MKRSIARILRKLANRLDRPPSAEPATPLEFIPTPELAMEIRRRNDASLVYWGRRKIEGNKFELTGSFHWQMRECELTSIIESILDQILESFDKNGEQP